jgi:hypothetical protein
MRWQRANRRAALALAPAGSPGRLPATSLTLPRSYLTLPAREAGGTIVAQWLDSRHRRNHRADAAF